MMSIENPEVRESISRLLLAMADDELILGQRDAEWCGHAPILEEDIAFANIALDEIGHAGLWYGVLAGLLDEDRDTYPDHLVYLRRPEEFRNSQFVELPPGDWAFTIIRQYLFDALEVCRLALLVSSSYRPIAEVAEKVQKEEIYHFRHTSAWVRRLGLGTEESRRRMQDALEHLWGYTGGLFDTSGDAGHAGDPDVLLPGDQVEREWRLRVEPFLRESGLRVPALSDNVRSPRSVHTEHHRTMILELQSVVRQYPEASW